MYPLLKTGDRLPSVAAAQLLVNRAMRRGESLDVDGIFGPRTTRAVREFQRGGTLSPDGVIGKKTWAALTRSQALQVIDAVDITDPRDVGYEDEAVRDAGGDPLVSTGMCKGVLDVAGRIMGRAGPGRVVLLRFHGHGSPGHMGLSVGTGAHGSSEFGLRYLDQLVRFLMPMWTIFEEFGSVELHGCRVGAGQKGRRLLAGLCRAWGVPVSAGIGTQWGGGSSTFRFEAAIHTAFPNGWDLKRWAQSFEEGRKVSVFR